MNRTFVVIALSGLLILAVCGSSGADSSGARAVSGDRCWEWFSWLVGAIGVIGTVGAAFLGVRATLKTLRHRQYETAAKMLQAVDQPRGPDYVTRTAAIAALAKLAMDYPEDYDEPVMRTFEAFLSFPPLYGVNAAKEGQVDYTSRDTVAIVQTIEKRSKKQRATYQVSLPPDRPFRVTAGGDVECNPNYKNRMA